jgi:hypothetical protein
VVALVRKVSLIASIVASAAVMITLVLVNIIYVVQSGAQSGIASKGLTIVLAIFILPMVLALTRGDLVACLIMTMLNPMGYMWVMVFYFSFVPWYVEETRES